MLKVSAQPLKAFSSQHNFTLFQLFGKKYNCKAIFDFNIHTSPINDSEASIVFRARENTETRLPDIDFSFESMSRWRVEVSQFNNFEEYLQSLSNSQIKNYKKSEEKFLNAKASLTVHENDWSSLADDAYQLYANVAERNPPQLYDLNFFRTISKMREYKMIGLWMDHSLIGAIVLLEEPPILHSILCGLNYAHSSKCNAYSTMHYHFLRYTIDHKQYQYADVGFSADEPKGIMGFKRVHASLDVKTKNRFLRGLLHLTEYFFISTINSQGKPRLRLRGFK